MMKTTSLPDVTGRVIRPSDPEYDAARATFYGGIDKHPAAIVRVADAEDVSRVVTFARESGTELAVRSGGHSGAGHSVSEGGIVIDLKDMHCLEIDPKAHTAWAEPGLTAAAYTIAADAHGLGTGFGDTRSVGIGGITLSGGVGYLVRKHGLTIDDLLAAEVLTADGELLEVDATNHADLFWALRGGGGNFGVATRLRFRLHELDQVVGGMLMLPAGPDLVTELVAAMEAAPEELSVIANVMKAPPLPFIPAEHHGKPVVMAMMVHAGEPDAGEQAIAPLRRLATPLADTVRPIRYPEMYAGPEAPHPVLVEGANLLIDELPAGSPQAILEHLDEASASMAAVQLRVLGGAMARVPDDATAFGHRGAKLMVNATALHDRPDERSKHREWANRLVETLSDRSTAGAYAGFIGDDGEEGM